MNPTTDTPYQVINRPFYQPQANEVTLFDAAYAARLPVMVKGPTGCGKSRFVEYMAWRLGKPLITVACNEDMTASDLVGRYLLEANGTRWLDGPCRGRPRLRPLGGGTTAAARVEPPGDSESGRAWHAGAIP